MTEPITVEIVYAEPDRYWRQSLAMPDGARVQDALAALDAACFPAGLRVDPQAIAIYGRKAGPDSPLHAEDRIELLRPLLCDPKDARRRRAAANPLKKPKT